MLRNAIGPRIGLLVLAMGFAHGAMAQTQRWLCLDHNGNEVQQSVPCPKPAKQPADMMSGAEPATPRWLCQDGSGGMVEQSEPCPEAARADSPAESIAAPGTVQCMGADGQAFEARGACPKPPKSSSAESDAMQSTTSQPRSDTQGLASHAQAERQSGSRSNASTAEGSSKTASSVAAPVFTMGGLPLQDGDGLASEQSGTSDVSHEAPQPVVSPSVDGLNPLERAAGLASREVDGGNAAFVPSTDEAKTSGIANKVVIFGALLALILAWMLRRFVSSKR